MTNLDSILKSRDITLPTKVRLEYWTGLPGSTGDLPDPGIELAFPASCCIAGGFFTAEPLEKPIIISRSIQVAANGIISFFLYG